MRGLVVWLPLPRADSRAYRRRMRRLLTLGVAVVGLMVMSSGVAWADCHGNGDNYGAATVHMGGSNKYQYMYWNKADRLVRVVSKTSSGMSTDICLDAYMDWMTESGHYDARIARNCFPATGSYRESDSGGDGYQPEPAGWGGRTVTGLQKAAGCKYLQTGSTSLGPCDYVEPESVCDISGAHPWTSKTQRVWIRFQNGLIDYNNGGDVWKHDS
jgi:hypothetical protein